MNNEYNDYNKDDEYTPRHANDSYQNSSNDLIIDNNLNYIYTNADNILDTINNDKNNELYQKYADIASKDKNVIFGGRLGMYKYYDMDKVISEALKCVEENLK